MSTAWNYIYGDNWREYIQHFDATLPEDQVCNASRQHMLDAVSETTTFILTGKNARDSLLHDPRKLGIGAENDSAKYGSRLWLQSLKPSLNAGFQWGFGHIIARTGAMDTSFETLGHLAKTPSQVAAYEQFEMARDAFRRGLHLEALEALDIAISGNKASPGYKLEWRFHMMKGVIRLGFYGCDVSLVDPAAANESFLLAARYAHTDEPVEAARAMLAAGWCNYVNGMLLEAWNYTQQAYALAPGMAEALFQMAKITVASGDAQKAMNLLRKALELAPDYSIKAAADGDFKACRDQLNVFLETMRMEAYNAITPKVWEALDNLDQWGQSISDPDEKQRILAGWRSLLEGEWGLLDLLPYALDGMRKLSQAAVGIETAMAFRPVQPQPRAPEPVPQKTGVPPEAAEKPIPQPTKPEKQTSTNGVIKKENREKERERKRNTWRFENRKVAVQREVQEPCQIEEEYFVNMVVRPKTIFAPEVKEQVKKTRLIESTRTVHREEYVQKKVLVNQLGETRAFPWKHFNFNPIPAGTFMMGSPPDEQGRSDDETAHSVTISTPFEMMIYPVTQALWAAVMGNNPAASKGENKPVQKVSWQDCQQFIMRLNELFESHNYRLPTEAEWEYACRAGSNWPFWNGGNLTAEQANYNGNYPYLNTPKGSYHGQPTGVGSYMPNAWGLYDMHGNVFEWCQDKYSDYPSESVVDPVSLAGVSGRVIRGGAWSSIAQNCRSAARNFHASSGKSVGIGFRLCRSIQND